MRLFMSHTSPYARMVRVTAREKGLLSQIEEIVVDPFADLPEVLETSPAGMIPALKTDDGQNLFESRLICAWLDALPSDQPSLVPVEGPARLKAQLAEALGQQVTDLSISRVFETRRQPQYQSPAVYARRRTQILRATAAIWRYVEDIDPAGPIHLGALTVGCGLGHVDFRHPDVEWREQNPELAAWQDKMNQRASLADTMPYDPK